MCFGRFQGTDFPKKKKSKQKINQISKLFKPKCVSEDPIFN